MQPADPKDSPNFESDFQAVKKLRNARDFINLDELVLSLRHQKLELKHIEKLFEKARKKV